MIAEQHRKGSNRLPPEESSAVMHNTALLKSPSPATTRQPSLSVPQLQRLAPVLPPPGFPNLGPASPPLIPPLLPRFPQPRNNNTLLSSFNPYARSYATENVHYRYTPYERLQLGLGNRNCLLSPGEQMAMHSAMGQNGKLYGTFGKSRASSR